jgi:Mn-dependent DtxR family transcriptional regulator
LRPWASARFWLFFKAHLGSDEHEAKENAEDAEHAQLENCRRLGAYASQTNKKNNVSGVAIFCDGKRLWLVIWFAARHS